MSYCRYVSFVFWDRQAAVAEEEEEERTLMIWRDQRKLDFVSMLVSETRRDRDLRGSVCVCVCSQFSLAFIGVVALARQKSKKDRFFVLFVKVFFSRRTWHGCSFCCVRLTSKTAVLMSIQNPNLPQNLSLLSYSTALLAQNCIRHRIFLFDSLKRGLVSPHSANTTPRPQNLWKFDRSVGLLYVRT